MANTTIYPYGTNGQLPSSIGVINDLTTGGADKALSAEQGKELYQMNQNLVSLPVMAIPTNGATVSSSKYRKFLFDDILFLDVSSRMYYSTNLNGSPFYTVKTLFKIQADANNYLTVTNAGGANYLWVALVKNGTQIHKSNNSDHIENTLQLMNHNIGFDFLNKRIVFTKADRSGTVTVTYTVDMSSWDFSGLEGKQVYFEKDFCSNRVNTVKYVYTFIRVNYPLSYEGILAKTRPYSIQGSFTQLPKNPVINRSNYITGLSVGTGNNTGITVTETISNTHKKYSCSRAGESYMGFFPSGNAKNLYPLGYCVFGVKFKLLSGTPTFRNGQESFFVIKPDGTWQAIAGFTFETNVEYTIISRNFYNTQGGYYSTYGLYGSGTFEFEVFDPFVLTPQKQLLSSDVVHGDIFTGSIPFSVGNTTFDEYTPYQNSSSTYFYYHLGELKFDSNKVYMWDGTAWKQISNA